MYHSLYCTLTRDQAEEAFAESKWLSPAFIHAITSTPADATFRTRCDPRDCDPSYRDEACMREITVQSRTASLAVDGWSARQQRTFDTDYDLLRWRDGKSQPVEPPYSGAESEAQSVVSMLDWDVTEAKHVHHFMQCYWFVPNLIIVTTSTEKHPLTIHTITPRQPIPTGRPATESPRHS